MACDSYPACEAVFKIPSGMVKRTDKLCEHDNFPIVQVIMKGKRPRMYCLKPDCKTKVSTVEAKEVKDIERHKIKKNCPKCTKELVVRKSFYGEFLACPGFPSCRYTENFNRATGHFAQPVPIEVTKDVKNDTKSKEIKSNKATNNPAKRAEKKK